MATGLKLEITVDDKGTAKIKKVEGAHKKLEKSVVGGSARMAAAVSMVRKRWASMKTMVSSVARIVKFALAGLAVATLVVGAKFEQSMANVGAILGRTREEMGLFIATARQLGATTVFSASQAADAMYSLASAGQTAVQILATAPAVLLFAGAASTNLGDAAEILVQTLAMFSLKASESMRVVNVFSAAIAGSLLNAERLKEGLSSVGSTAAALGLELEQTVAVLGKLNSAGQVGGIAGTRLKNVLTRLAAPNAVLKELMGDVTLKTDGLTASMLALKDADPGQIFKAFGRIAAPAVLVLRNITDEMKELEAQITGTNKAQEMFDIQMNTVQAQFKIFKSQLQENMIASFFALRDAGFDAFQMLTRGLAAVKGPLVGFIATGLKLIQWSTDFVAGNIKTIAAFFLIGVALTAITFKARIATVAVATLKAALTFLTGPIGIILAITTALTIAWVVWGDKIKEVVSAATNKFVDFASDFIDTHETAVSTVIGFFKTFANNVIGTAVFIGLIFWELGKDMIKGMKTAFIWIKDKIKAIVDWAGPLLKKLGIALGDSFADIEKKLNAEQEERKSSFAENNAYIVAIAEKAYGVDYVAAIGSGLGAALDVAKEKLNAIKTVFKSAADAASADVVPPTKEESRLFNIGLVVAGYEPILTPEEELAKKRAAVTAAANIAIVSAAKVEDYRRAVLVRTIGNEAVKTQEWLDARLELIRSNYDEEAAAAGNNEEMKAEIAIQRSAEVAQARQEHQDAVLDHFYETHQVELALLDVMGAAYDSFFSSVLDSEMTGKKRREKIWADTKRSFVKIFSGMIKFYIFEHLRGLLITSAATNAAAKKARVTDAKTGAVRAYGAFAGIPIVGPVLGAIAAAAAFAFLMAFHTGGQVQGTSLGRDTVPAILEPREFVVRREAAERVGLSNLEHINQTGTLPPGSGGDIYLQIDASGGSRSDDLDELTDYLEDEVVPRLEDIMARGRFKI